MAEQSEGRTELNSGCHEHSPSIVVIGVGNVFRSDDGLGIYAVRELRLRMQTAEHRLPQPIAFIEESGEATSLMRAWEGYRHVFIIDAVRSSKASGSVHVIDALSEAVPSHFFASSSHHLGIAEAIEMARKLNRLPKTLKLYGIEGETMEAGVGLSEPVVRSMADLLHLLEDDIRSTVASNVLEHL
jgi:hydrogenase maturation protease